MTWRLCRYFLVAAALLLLCQACSVPEQGRQGNPQGADPRPEPPPAAPEPRASIVYTEMEAGYLDELEALVRRARPRTHPRLERSRALDSAALLHARDMARRGYFDHDSPEGTEPADRVALAAPGAIVSDVRENLYFLETNTPGDYRTRAQGAHQGLMNSPGHRENILNTRSTHIGLAVVRASDGNMAREYTVQLFGREVAQWGEPVPGREWPAQSGAKSFPIRILHDEVEFYVIDHDGPARRYPLDPLRVTIGGFHPRFGPGDRTMQLPALERGFYSLHARFRGEDGYAPTTYSFIVR